jgi:hypothetical protein
MVATAAQRERDAGRGDLAQRGVEGNGYVHFIPDITTGRRFEKEKLGIHEKLEATMITTSPRSSRR